MLKLGGQTTITCDNGTTATCNLGTLECYDNSPYYCPVTAHYAGTSSLTLEGVVVFTCSASSSASATGFTYQEALNTATLLAKQTTDAQLSIIITNYLNPLKM
jgi:hypothetical protein